MAFSSFTININDVFKYEPSLTIDTNTLTDLMTQAQDRVEDDLRQIVYEKFRDAGYDLVNDLPTEPLDIILSGAYPQIRKKIIFYTLMLVNINDPDAYAVWQTRYNDQPIGDVYFNLDIDQSGSITLEEVSTDMDELTIELR